MSTSFGILFSIRIVHSYYISECIDFEFIVPPDTATTARNGKIITRTNKGVFYALCEKNETGIPLIPITNLTMRFGLKLNNPFFLNITRMDFSSGSTPLYRNLASSASLDAGIKTILTSSLFAHPLTKTTRPVTVIVKDSIDTILHTVTNSDSSNTSPIPVDLRGFTSGIYPLIEKYTGSTKKTMYYLDPELSRLQTFAIVEIKIANSFYSSSPPRIRTKFRCKRRNIKILHCWEKLFEC